MYQNKEIGRRGENIACEYLIRIGLLVVCKNFYCRFGEIDIIAKDGEELVFIEVKTRTNNKYGNPSDSVDYNKRNHLHRAIEYFIYTKNIKNINIRVDVIEVYLKSNKVRVNHIKNVFL